MGCGLENESGHTLGRAAHAMICILLLERVLQKSRMIQDLTVFPNMLFRSPVRENMCFVQNRLPQTVHMALAMPPLSWRCSLL